METPKTPLRICAQVSDVPGGRSRVRPGAPGEPAARGRPGYTALSRRTAGVARIAQDVYRQIGASVSTACVRLLQAPWSWPPMSSHRRGPGRPEDGCRSRPALVALTGPRARRDTVVEVVSFRGERVEVSFPLPRYSRSGPGPRGFF